MPKCLPKYLCHFAFLPQWWVPVLPHSQQDLVWPVFWIFGLSCCYLVVSHCCFNLQFPIWCWTFFHMLTSHMCIFIDMVLSSFAQFIIGFFMSLMLSFKNFLYILDSRSLSGMLCTGIFSQSMAFHFILLTFLFFLF